MKKYNNRGFMLVEVLIATIVSSSLLIFLFLQLTNLSNSYEKNQKYNSVQSLYYLKNIKEYIESDRIFLTKIGGNFNVETPPPFVDLNCIDSSDVEYCMTLLILSNVDKIIVTINDISNVDFSSMEDTKFKNFINSIASRGSEAYRLIARFTDETYATLRLGGV